jgi:hypothetical protein
VSFLPRVRARALCAPVFWGKLSQKMPKWKRKGTFHPRSNVRGHIVVLAFGRGQRVDAADDSSLRWWQPKENTQNFFQLVNNP